MNVSKVIMITLAFLSIGCSGLKGSDEVNQLKIIEQDYIQALAEAKNDNKLLLIDFYTSWCAPCKKLDKLVFQNDSVTKLLANDIVLLRYDAENDSVFHLSKKHHISSYPTGIILNKDGRVVNRKYGFPGEDLASLSSSVLDFVAESGQLNEDGKYLSGYSDKIDPSLYPGFYVDYVNRTNTDKDSSEINGYLSSTKDVFSEQYFSTLLYFAFEASDNIANVALSNKDKYENLYGETDVDILAYSLVVGKFQRAITAKSQAAYDEAVSFAKTSLSKEWTDDILPSFEKDYLMAQGKWDKVFALYDKMKRAGEMSNGYINHFSWQVYKNCDDPEVIKNCIGWMKEVTDDEPEFDYLDTYAYLTYKSGDKDAAKQIARSAIEAGKRDNRKTTGLEKLIEKINRNDR